LTLDGFFFFFAVLVVLIFILCWSPYQIIHIWYFLHRESAAQVNLLVQEILFIFGVSSCVVDPYVYGLYSMGLWREMEFFSNVSCAGWSRNNRKAKRVSFVANGQIGLYSLNNLKRYYVENERIVGPVERRYQDEVVRKSSPSMTTARMTL
jgi:hypothetical protein